MKLFKFNFSTLAMLIILYYGVYYLLLTESFHTSIAAIISYSNHLPFKGHILVLALLPIYIALIIFGAAILAVYLGYFVQYLLKRHKASLIKPNS
ncbi:MAG: hypothetical protein H0W64_05920 [Gammaproteobacteria bacterium]|nr:hypothetical protein [Gammaproteobacteria bacterium]